tara:strand:- start:886 stop:1197 length:312 start_codon:yes stop_codon:yes gene_type:complete
MKNGNGKSNGNGHVYLSQIKLDVLNFIKNFIENYSYAPTYKEIGTKFNFSRARAGALIAEFYKLGFISKGNQAHRNIELNKDQLKIISKLKVNKTYSTMDFRR